MTQMRIVRTRQLLASREAMSDDVVEIRGQEVALFREGPDGPRLDRKVHLSDFLQAVASTHPGPMKDRSLFLPGGTRLAQVRGASTILVIEQPPRVRQVRWTNESKLDVVRNAQS